ncbi:hypothetical protein OT109_00355 [Phycisphaeraceae bacterium D3-23]
MKHTPSEAAAAARPLLTAMARLDIPCYIGGSLASSAHGASRSTIDADLVADVRSDQAEALFHAIEPEYFADVESIRRAALQRDSFNLLHRKLMIKIDVFVLKHYKYERQVIDRIIRLPLDPARPDDLLPFCSVEDIILNKLMWYDTGGRVSERQWSDLVTVMRVQRGAMDHAYLEQWADYLDVAELLRQALDRAREQDGL